MSMSWLAEFLTLLIPLISLITIIAITIVRGMNAKFLRIEDSREEEIKLLRKDMLDEWQVIRDIATNRNTKIWEKVNEQKDSIAVNLRSIDKVMADQSHLKEMTEANNRMLTESLTTMSKNFLSGFHELSESFKSLSREVRESNLQIATHIAKTEGN